MLDVQGGVLLGVELVRRESTKGRGRQGVEVPLHGMAQVRGVREEQGKFGRCFLPVQIFGGERGNII